MGFESEIHFTESQGKSPLNNNQSVKDDKTAMKDTLGTTIDLSPAETVAETFSVASSELAKVCEAGKETEANVENDSSTVPEEQGTEEEVIVGQMPNHISLTVQKKAVDPASIDSVIANISDTNEFSNGSLTTEQPVPTSCTEYGSCKNDIAITSEVTSVQKATVGKGKVDASSSQKGNIATLSRIKPQSWKGQSNVARQETNLLLAALKSFLIAFVKSWSE